MLGTACEETGVWTRHEAHGLMGMPCVAVWYCNRGAELGLSAHCSFFVSAETGQELLMVVLSMTVPMVRR